MSNSSNNREQSTNKQTKKVPRVKNALVFMAVGHDFRITVAYKLLNGMIAIDRAIFTQEVIRRIGLTGAKIISLTSDDLYANTAVAKLLGAKFEDSKPYFHIPTKLSERIYIIFDPPHMIKLLRKYLSEQMLKYGEHEMQWELLKKLVTKQDSDNFSLSNKLTRNHISWMDHKMNVKKAVQIFSNENADALEQLCDDFYEDFIGCEKFIEFLRLTNNIFDIMNFGEGKKSDSHYKQPLCSSTVERFFQLFNSFKEFVHKMTVEVKREPNAKRVPASSQMGFAGFLINIQSTIGIYEDYVKETKSGVFYTFQYGQDHLETYFSLIRGSLGGNNNPNIQQFQSAYRKLSFCSPHISGLKTNCNVEFPHELLNISSQVVSVPQDSMHMKKVLQAQAIDFELDYYALIDIEMEPYEQHMYALAASAVENAIIKRFQKQTKSTCIQSMSIFEL